MIIDIMVVVGVVWGLVRGGLKGFLLQLGQMAVLLVAFALARGLGQLVEPWLDEWLDVPEYALGPAAFFLVFTGVSLVGALIVHSLARDIHKAAPSLTGADRALGVVLGGAKGLLIAYVCIVGLIELNQATGSVPIPYGSSVAGRWVMQHNILESQEFPRAKALAKLGWLVYQNRADRLHSDPHFRAVLEHPKAQMLKEDAITQALIEGDWLTIVSHEAVWDLLDEPEIQEHLNAIELEESATDNNNTLDPDDPDGPPRHPSKPVKKAPAEPPVPAP